MSDTPRTDEATYWDYASSGNSVDADFARELERDLNEAKKSPWKSIDKQTPYDYKTPVFYRHTDDRGFVYYGVEPIGYCPTGCEYMEIPK